MESKDQLRKIAIYCDSYNPEENTNLTFSSSTNEKNVESCTNCRHYTENKNCELDLIDKVLTSLSMEQDLKS